MYTIFMQNGSSNMMNLPNSLSIFRILLVPFIILLLSLQNNFARLMALILFLIASLSDFADGYIARKYNKITDFGKFLDPIADKLLVVSTLAMLAGQGEISSIYVIIIITRELCVDGLRLVASTKNSNVIAASYLGKLKTVLQILACILLLARLNFVVSYTFLLLAVFMTIVSGVDYFIKNKNVFR